MIIRALIVIAALFGFLSNAQAKDNNPFSGATSISVVMTQDTTTLGKRQLINRPKPNEVCTAASGVAVIPIFFGLMILLGIILAWCRNDDVWFEDILSGERKWGVLLIVVGIIGEICVLAGAG